MSYQPPTKIPYQFVVTGPVKSVADFSEVDVYATTKIYTPVEKYSGAMWICREDLFYAQQRIPGRMWKNDETRSYILDGLLETMNREHMSHKEIKVRANEVMHWTDERRYLL